METSSRIFFALFCCLSLCLPATRALAQPELMQPKRPEVARLLGGDFFTMETRGVRKRYEQYLFKGMSIRPVGSILINQRQFLVALIEKEAAPGDIIGWPKNWCLLMFLEQKNNQMSVLGRYSLPFCMTPKISGQRVTFRYRESDGGRVVTRGFVVGAKGPPAKVNLDSQEITFVRGR